MCNTLRRSGSRCSCWCVIATLPGAAHSPSSGCPAGCVRLSVDPARVGSSFGAWSPFYPECSRVSGCAQGRRGGIHFCHGVMVFSQPLCPLLLAGHDQGVYWPLCVGVAALNSSHGVRVGLLLRAVMIRNIAFRVSLSSLFFSGFPALRSMS